MKRENLHQPFEICFSELDESQLKEHDHTFFELVYILSGTGIQWINNNKFPYHDGHLFMITPGDIHSFGCFWGGEHSTAGIYIATCQSPSRLYIT